ncbi:NAD(P)-dependent oxidoreductase [Kribbella sp. NPDC051586]|uniref:NAD(P)-dependent oxidoreductase n=1 Tax=Kribbella sp. NPDC051586 TaxID=3364118 RepID=UPI0037887D11
MRLTLFAATGGVGRQLLRQAVAAGHDVTAVVRDPNAFRGEVRTVRTDLLSADADVLREAVDGADAVLSGLGPRSRSEVGIVSAGTRRIVDAMLATTARRLVIISVAGIGLPPGGPRSLRERLLSGVAVAVMRKHYADVAAMETMLRTTCLDWTSVGVPLLSDDPPTGTYRTAVGRRLPKAYRLSRADAAHCMLATLDQPETVRRTIAVAY